MRADLNRHGQSPFGICVGHTQKRLGYGCDKHRERTDCCRSLLADYQRDGDVDGQLPVANLPPAPSWQSGQARLSGQQHRVGIARFDILSMIDANDDDFRFT
jgi:hypothetical protein